MRSICAVVLALVLLDPARAQTLPPVGTDATLDVATWNIEWFGSTINGPSDEDLQLQNAARVIRESEIDLWAIQEIDDEERFEALVDTLGPEWAGELDSAGSNFKFGFIYRTDRVVVTQKTSILTQFSSEFAGRPPLQIAARLMLPADTLEVIFITLHMKAFGDAESYERRDEASFRLKNHLDFFLDREPVVILGDFNDELTGSISSGRESPYAEFLVDADDYGFVTLPLDEQDTPTYCETTWCTSGSTIDHILITDELFDRYEEGSSSTYDEVVDAITQYSRTTSDHLPVFARFDLSVHTAIEDVPARATGDIDVYPNPFSASAVIEVTTRGSAELTILDVAGREVRRVISPFSGTSTQQFRVDGTGLASGVYFAVIRHEGGVDVRRLVRLP